MNDRCQGIPALKGTFAKVRHAVTTQFFTSIAFARSKASAVFRRILASAARTCSSVGIGPVYGASFSTAPTALRRHTTIATNERMLNVVTT